MNLKSYKIGRDVSRLLGLIEILGPRSAARFLIDTYAGLGRSSNIKVNVPGLKQSVELRRNSTDVNVFLQIFAMKEYELRNFIQSNATRERYDKIIARGMTPLIIDCGANCGMSVLWWRKVFPLAKIIAIEPSSANFDALIANTHHDSRIECIKSAIWSRRTTLHVDNPADSAWALRFSDHGADLEERPSGQTDTITIPEIIEKEA